MVWRAALVVCWVSFGAHAATADVSAPSGVGCDEEAQGIALRISTGIFLDAALCTRIGTDLARIRKQDAALATFHDWEGPEPTRELWLRVDARTFRKIKDGTYSEWSRFNRQWGMPTVVNADASLTIGGSRMVLVRMPRVMHLDAVAKAYRKLPGVQSAEPRWLGGDGPTISATRRDDSMHYLFDDAGGDCMAGCFLHHWYYFIVDDAGRIARVAEWKDRVAVPPSVPKWVFPR
jgi:hypothetical protein